MNRRSTRRLVGLIAAAMTLPLLVTACFALPPMNTSYEQTIPAALEDADLGLSEVWASRATDGFSVVLSVGGTSDSGEVSAQELRQILQLISDNNTLGGNQLRLSLRADSDRASVDLDRPAQELGAAPQGDGSEGQGITLSWEEVDRLLG